MLAKPLFFLAGELQPRLLKEKRTFLVVAIGYSVDLNCQLNDSSAQVTLLQEDSSKKTHPRVADGVKVTQSGQIFTINNVQHSDKGRYYCRVQPWVLRIEFLHTAVYSGSQGNQLNVLFVSVLEVSKFILRY